MARLRGSTKHDESAAILSFYRELLARPYVRPESKYDPVKIGPSWLLDGDEFVLPERSVGWDGLVFAGEKMQLKRGEPWKFTAEQARLWLWWYSVDEAGAFTFDREGVIQRLKGWGKDPWAAVMLGNELVGPCRFSHFDGDRAVGADEPDAWVQLAAVTQEQTKNTMRLFPRLFTDDAKREFKLQIGKEQIYALGDQRFLQAVTSNPAPLEGGRATMVLLNETHWFLANNNGLEMYDVIERNSAKSAGGGARVLHITNAYDPGMDSLAERTRQAWELSQGENRRNSLSGLMYDSLEAPPEAPLTAEDAPEVVSAVRGDSVWLDLGRIKKSILDPRNPPSRSRRFWYNQITANEESWMSPIKWDAQQDPENGFQDGQEIVMFFDGSKSDDATALVGVRVSDGFVQALGLWQAPPQKRRGEWVAPRGEVSQRVRALFKQFRVVGFWGDPSHTKEDGTLDLFWQPLIDEWHRDFSPRLTLWASTQHSIAWDMSNTSSSGKGKLFVPAAEAFVEAVENGEIWHDGNKELGRHVKNARRFPTRFGVSLSKDGPESPRKIDLAVCAVGATLMRRTLLNSGKKSLGKIW
ncbi:phage terminase family protein [Leucobacter rhizosphaerae]|uniref:Phage terminase family protein n=1 Tax=Leucobacter rhizosphaerae TaxID=2932245 RepID=A0ABY4FVP4_9MICO|nr:phage terminase family protein [Leucobacter rhizosphaerae]UOQ60378.1 phage terminase family protein [Leucobacter rhizosphaerae]